MNNIEDAFSNESYSVDSMDSDDANDFYKDRAGMHCLITDKREREPHLEGFLVFTFLDFGLTMT